MRHLTKFLLCVSGVLLLATPLQAHAVTVPMGGTGGNSGNTGTPSTPSNPSGEVSGEWSGEDGGGSFEGDIEFPYPNYTTYYPKVTSLKSVNALLADAGEPIYFLPTLDAFPTDMRNLVSSLTDGNGKLHRFAVVYDGYFDSDVLFQSDTPYDSDNSRVHTSKKVYSMDYNSRLCNYLGYDILLRDERYYMDSYPDKKIIEFSYNATRVGNSLIDTQTAIMDLYKAVGVYEWDIEVAYGYDLDFDANTSPILQSIGVLTTDKNQGLDTSESYVWIAATRTNPDLYWARCERDLIFDGGAHLYSGNYWGNEVSVTGNFSKGSYPTLGEFCAMARAVMSLYGEPVLTAAEQKACLNAYGLYVPETSYSKDIYNSIVYLAAKGIIDPEGKDFNSTCTFEDIEEILLRIADEDARLTIKTPAWHTLMSRGFSKIDNLVFASPGVSVTEMQSSDLPYYDFLIEVKPGYTEYMTYTSSPATEFTYGTYASNDYGFKSIDADHVGIISSTDIANFTSQSSAGGFAALNATGVTIGVLLDGASATYGTSIAFFTSDDVVRNLGIVEYEGKQYYHMQVALNRGFGGITSVALPDGTVRDINTLKLALTFETKGIDDVVRRDPHVSGLRLREASDYIYLCQLPSNNGGVYNIDDKGNVSYTSFLDGGFDASFRDSESTIFNTPGLTTYTASNKLFAITLPMNGILNSNALASCATKLSESAWKLLFDCSGSIVDMGDGHTKGWATQVTRSSNIDGTSENCIRLEFYCTDSGNNLTNDGTYKNLVNSANTAEQSKDKHIGFYRSDSGTLLVSASSLTGSGIFASITQLSEYTYVIAVNGSNSTMATNVTLHYKEGDTSNFICVGNTLYPCKSMSNPDEVLFEKVDGELYINYIAVTGWGTSVILTPMSADGTVYAYTADSLRNDVKYYVQSLEPTYRSQYVIQYMPKSQVLTYRMQVACTSVTGSFHERWRTGFSLLSAYPLADYLMVTGPMDAVTGDATDYLFTWHIKGTNSSTENVDDLGARQLFGQLTGTVTPAANDLYYLNCLKLSRAEHYEGNNDAGHFQWYDTNESGFVYTRRVLNTKASGTVEVGWGWIYTPTYYANVTDAVAAWDAITYDATFNNKSRENSMPISIFATGNGAQVNDWNQTFGDANINHTYDEVGTMRPGGVLPGYFYGVDYGITTLQPDGSLKNTSKEDSTGINISGYKVVPAPVGQFAAFTAGIASTVESTRSNVDTIYWGTAKLGAYNSTSGTIKIGNAGVLPLEGSTPIVRTFTGTMGNAIWVVNTGTIAVSSDMTTASTKFGAKIFENMPTVDWSRYSFSRLIKSVDSWSTVLLIFFLNILPRVCVVMFFLLLLLSTIVNWTAWRTFCNTYFDPYKFLTLGHQNVNTVSMKRLILISSICIVFFSMIQDGVLIDVILWISEWFIRFTSN